MSDTHLLCARSRRDRRGRVRSTLPRARSRRSKSLYPVDKDEQSGRDVSLRVEHDQNMPIPHPHFRSRSRSGVFPAGEGFNDHAASSPPPSQTAYLRRQRGHFYPPPLSAFGTLLTPLLLFLLPSISPLITLGGWNAFITRPFSLQTFGIGVGKEWIVRERKKREWRTDRGEEIRGWKFEKEENGDRW